jgi:hypothetical protein
VFTCATASLFVLAQRTKEVVVGVLGEQFANWLMSDGYVEQKISLTPPISVTIIENLCARSSAG